MTMTVTVRVRVRVGKGEGSVTWCARLAVTVAVSVR